MKITRLFLSFLLVASLSAHAQFAVIPVFGPNFGISHSKSFANRGLSSLGLKTGLLGEYVFTDLVGVQTGALYSTYALRGYPTTLTARAVEIPCMLLLRHCSKWSHNKIIFGVGPYLGLQINGRTGDMLGTGRQTIAIDKYTPPAYIGMKVTVGYELQSDFYFRFSLQPGITNLTTEPRREYYLSQLSLGLGYIIHFGSDPEDYAENPDHQAN